MADHEDLASQVASRIRSGELPSVVVRSLMQKTPGLRVYGLLEKAFEAGSFLNILGHWRRSESSPAADAQFDVFVIHELLSAGVELPWDRAWCESEHDRIGPALRAEASARHAERMRLISYELLREKVLSLEGRPACIQAIWDGDSEGWCISLSVVMESHAQYSIQDLGQIRFGGDARLFTGEVPPWPEAKYATDVCGRLAAELAAEFYFPSPDSPDVNLPHWLDVGAHNDVGPERKQRPWWWFW